MRQKGEGGLEAITAEENEGTGGASSGRRDLFIETRRAPYHKPVLSAMKGKSLAELMLQFVRVRVRAELFHWHDDPLPSAFAEILLNVVSVFGGSDL
jgi:hypothetical protein